MRVLITCAGGLQGQSLAYELHRLGISVVAVDCFSERLVEFCVDQFVTISETAASPEYVKKIIELCKLFHIDLVIPATGIDLLVLARAAATFSEEKIPLAVSSPELLSKTEDKGNFYSWLAMKGLPFLPVFAASEAALHLPIYAKPRVGWGGRHHTTLKNRADADEFCRRHGDTYVYQRHVEEFSEYSVDLAISLNGNLLSYAVRERVHVSQGTSLYSRSIELTEIRELLEKLIPELLRLGLRGIANIQLLNVNGNIAISDLNPRFGTSTNLRALGIKASDFINHVEERSTSRTVDASRWISYRPLEQYHIKLATPLRQLQAVVFDLDDTIYRHSEWFWKKLEIVANSPSYLQYRTRLFEAASIALDNGRRETFIDVLAEAIPELSGGKPELLKAFRNASVSKLTPQKGLVLFLEQLRHNNVRVGILSNGRSAVQDEKLTALGIRHLISAVCYCTDPSPSKPHPEAFASIAAQLGVSAEECIMVGNEFMTDIFPAIRARFAVAVHMSSEYALSGRGITSEQWKLCSQQEIERIMCLTSFCELRVVWNQYLGRRLSLEDPEL